MKDYFAHSLNDRPLADWEPLERHLEIVASGEGTFGGAAGFAAAFGAEECGRVLGLWHDIGKYSDAFQTYIRGASKNQDDEHQADVASRVDHSTGGAQQAAKLGPLGLLLAYCIAGHHAGLPDNVGTESSLSMRLKKQVPVFDIAPAALLAIGLPSMPRLQPPRDKRVTSFTIAYFTRMLFSCLVDADFLATESFMDRQRADMRSHGAATAHELLRRIDAYLSVLRRDDTEVNRRRHEVLCACRDKARLAPGLFSLQVPTGGGKTLSSLVFGLTHAAQHGLRQVIYAIPFTSIIEQTADVFRVALSDMADSVLEHHSNVELDDPSRESARSRLAAENWDAPIVVTTNVQLFESLFANRTSRCRKLHRLTRSVIILDEAQTLPINLLAPTLAALDELVRNYGSTVVLCTATQPALERRDGFAIGLETATPIVDAPNALHKALKRAQVQKLGVLSNEEVVDRLRDERQALCIVNSRRHAAELFELLDDAEAFQLSASMCAAHRSHQVKAIRDRLASHEPCRVISTQVIEAGVDVDFPVVFRAAAGLDSIAQAAGRCNREGQLQDPSGRPALGRVVVFDYDETANRPPQIILTAAAHYRDVTPDYAEDLLSPQAIEAYFRLHYWQQGGDDGSGWDRGREGKSVLDCFGLDPQTGLHAQFREAANRYQLIDDFQTAILVPYSDRGEALIAELAAMPDDPDPKWLRGFDRRAQRYVVAVPENLLSRLLEQRVLLERHERYYLGNPEAYDRRIGLTLSAVGLNVEDLVI